jgi:hypothetical protein
MMGSRRLLSAIFWEAVVEVLATVTRLRVRRLLRIGPPLNATWGRPGALVKVRAALNSALIVRSGGWVMLIIAA